MRAMHDKYLEEDALVLPPREEDPFWDPPN